MMATAIAPKNTLRESGIIRTQFRTEGYETSKSYTELVTIDPFEFIDTAVKESLDTTGEALAANGKVIVTG